MIGGKKFKTLREAKKYEKEQSNPYIAIYNLPKSKVYKYFVGTHLEWLNL